MAHLPSLCPTSIGGGEVTPLLTWRHGEGMTRRQGQGVRGSLQPLRYRCGDLCVPQFPASPRPRVFFLFCSSAPGAPLLPCPIYFPPLLVQILLSPARFTGTVTVKLVPTPTSLSREMSPFRASTAFLAMVNPKPVPRTLPMLVPR